MPRPSPFIIRQIQAAEAAGRRQSAGIALCLRRLWCMSFAHDASVNAPALRVALGDLSSAVGIAFDTSIPSEPELLDGGLRFELSRLVCDRLKDDERANRVLAPLRAAFSTEPF